MLKNHYKYFEKLEDQKQQLEFTLHVHSIIDSLVTKLGTDNAKLHAASLDALAKLSWFPLMDYAVQLDRMVGIDGTKDTSGHLVIKMKHI